MTDRALAETKACVFDAYGTLFDLTSAARRCADALGGKAEALSALWRTRQLEYSWLRSLMGRHADFWQVTGEALDYAMAQLGIASPALRERLMDAFLTIDAYADARGVLEALRRARRPAAILSNGSPRMLVAATESAGVAALLDHVLSVEDAGIYKPDRRVYELATRRLGLAAERICFVSSNGWDAAGAASFGFKAVWANRAGAPRERLPAEPVAEIASLDALPALLGLG
ncbi:MAG TPA: haloacid dehalogenase type II [Stellaceae bacterium]|jgi:2-haloacid dehalogenase|nr:haloacid dehalogenase type II [Stellaceae bacterium]